MQNLTFSQVKQAQMPILEKTAHRFGGKIQMWLKSGQKNWTLEKLHLYSNPNLFWGKTLKYSGYQIVRNTE